jgi:uncharacterized RDD family membrane protein YckC
VDFAGRCALAALLATGLSFFYPWSANLTWFGITLAISGVRRSVVSMSVGSAGT